MSARALALAALPWLLLVGCRAPSDGSREARTEKVCDCACGAGGRTGDVAPPATAATAASATPTDVARAPSTTAQLDQARRVSDLLVTANRKMMQRDGAGCLADLEAARALDPKLEAQMAVVRAQCEMQMGQCQAGKARVKAYYLEDAGLGPDQSERMAEAIASMHCSGGDSTDRDRFLVAAQQLTEAAYLERKPPAYCKERITLLRDLGARVPARQFDDGQVTGTKQALFYTAAACYARAGDCAAAYAIYEELFPKDGFPPGIDAGTKKTVIKTSFESSIERCRP